MLEIYQEVTHRLRPRTPTRTLLDLQGVDEEVHDLAFTHVYQEGDFELLGVLDALGLEYVLAEEEGFDQQDLEQLTEGFLGLLAVYCCEGLLLAPHQHLALRPFCDYLLDLLELVGVLDSKEVEANQQVPEANRHLLPRDIHVLSSLAHGHALDVRQVIIDLDVEEHMQHAHLRQFLERVLGYLLIELSIERLLFYLARPPLNLVDAFPKPLFLHLQGVKLLLQHRGLFLQLIQLPGQLFLLHLQQPDFLLFFLYYAFTLAL